jgi:hypothetical protein
VNELFIDPERWSAAKEQPNTTFPDLIILKTGLTSAKFVRLTDIYIRAVNPDTQQWEPIDIAFLTTASLSEWLRSRGGANQWAENCALLILGHTTEGGPHKAVRSDDLENE